jgi:hypothetical protein
MTAEVREKLAPPTMASDADREWLEEFKRGLIQPQPLVRPLASDCARERIAQIDRQIEALKIERRRLCRVLQIPMEKTP